MRQRDLAPFDVFVIETRPVDHYELVVRGSTLRRTPVSGLKLAGTKWSIVPIGPLAGFLHDEGTYQNTSANEYYFPEVCAAAFTTRGRFLMVGQVPAQSLHVLAHNPIGFNGEPGSYAPPAKVIGVRLYIGACTEDDVAEGFCE